MLLWLRSGYEMQSRALRSRNRSTAGRSPKSHWQAAHTARRRITSARAYTNIASTLQTSCRMRTTVRLPSSALLSLAPSRRACRTRHCRCQLDSRLSRMRSASDGRRSASRKHWKGSEHAAQRRPEALSPAARRTLSPCSSRRLHLHPSVWLSQRHLRWRLRMSCSAVDSEGQRMQRHWRKRTLTSAFARKSGRRQEQFQQVAPPTQSTATCRPRRLGQAARLWRIVVRLHWLAAHRGAMLPCAPMGITVPVQWHIRSSLSRAVRCRRHKL
jgi:hypothetical protein